MTNFIPKLLSHSLLVAAMGLGGCSTLQTPRPYGSHGPGEVWLIADQDDADAAEVARQVQKQRSWGWATNYVVSSHDDGVTSFIAGPFAYAGQDPASITVSVWLFADPPVTGHVIVEATPEDGATLQENWAEPLEFPITMTQGWHSQDIVLPKFQGPVQSAHIRWVTAPVSNDSGEHE